MPVVNLHAILQGGLYCSPFKDEETEAQSGS